MTTCSVRFGWKADVRPARPYLLFLAADFVFVRAFPADLDLDNFAFFAPGLDAGLAPALFFAGFVEVPLGPDLAAVSRLVELPFVVFLADFDISPRRASPAMVPTADPNAAPALARAPSRTSSRAAFRALRLATAVTTTAARASRASGFFRRSRACLPKARVLVFPTDDFAV